MGIGIGIDIFSVIVAYSGISLINVDPMAIYVSINVAYMYLTQKNLV